MGILTNLDGKVIGLADRFAVWLAHRGGNLQAVQREVLTGDMLLTGYLPIAAIMAGSPVVGMIWGLASVFLVTAKQSSWKMLDRDSKVEWSPELARKYFSRAETARKQEGFRVLFGLLLVGHALSLALSWGTEAFSALNVALVLWMFVTLVRIYVDCAHPVPPSAPRKSFVPSYA